MSASPSNPSTTGPAFAPEAAGSAAAAAPWAQPTQWSGPAPAASDAAAPPAEETELYVSCAPSVALQQQFEQRPMAFVAVHDIGPAGSRRLLTGVAAAAHRPLHRLLIRRRSFGDLLATVLSVEMPGPGGEVLRVFTTDVEATNDAERHALMHTLLAFARLGVVMVGGEALQQARTGLADLDRALSRPPWPNRHLLLLPMGPAVGLAAVGQDLAVRHGLQVLTTPVVNRPSEAWHFIQSSHARLMTHGVLSSPRRFVGLSDSGFGAAPGSTRPPASTGPDTGTPGADGVPTQPVPLPGRPSFDSARSGLPGRAEARRTGPTGPATLAAGGSDPWEEIPLARLEGTLPPGLAGSGRAPGHRPDAGGTDPRADPIPWPEAEAATAGPMEDPVLQQLLDRASRLGGFVGACVFNLASGRALAHRGEGPEAQALGRRGAALVNAASEAARSLHLEPGFGEVWITLPTHHLIVRPVAGHRHLGLHVVLDRQVANPMLARVQLQRLDEDPAIATGGGL